MQCTSPVWITKNLDPAKYPQGLELPCGKCLACRIKKRSEWSLRMMLELHYWEKSSFITLTYDEDHLPINGSLDKGELQKFFKRLRKNLPGREIKYFACGEYGDSTQRPHYHSILFGVGLDHDDKEAVKASWRKCDWKNPKILKGSFGMVEPESIRYVAQYIDKKYTGEKADEEYTQFMREPVFRLMSLGIGKKFCDEFGEQIKEDLYISKYGVKYSLPRYYCKRLEIDNYELSKFAIEKNQLQVERLTGLSDMPSDFLYNANSKEFMKYYDALKSIRKQKSKTLEGKSKVKSRKL